MKVLDFFSVLTQTKLGNRISPLGGIKIVGPNHGNMGLEGPADGDDYPQHIYGTQDVCGESGAHQMR